MRNGIPHIAALSRTLAMLEAVIEDGGQSSVSAIARSIGMPVATAHRQVATLVAEGYLRTGTGLRHMPGPRLVRLAYLLDVKPLIANVAGPILQGVAQRTGCVVQLGTLENDMVTYRLKIGHGAGTFFTKVGMQLEAYCSGIGKVLLAHLPPDQRQAYLAAGPFIALTPATITQPAELSRELDRVRDQGHAIDDGEIEDGLVCLAVPVRATDGSVPAAISISMAGTADDLKPRDGLVLMLNEAARAIELAVFGG